MPWFQFNSTNLLAQGFALHLGFSQGSQDSLRSIFLYGLSDLQWIFLCPYKELFSCRLHLMKYPLVEYKPSVSFYNWLLLFTYRLNLVFLSTNSSRSPLCTLTELGGSEISDYAQLRLPTQLGQAYRLSLVKLTDSAKLSDLHLKVFIHCPECIKMLIWTFAHFGTIAG